MSLKLNENTHAARAAAVPPSEERFEILRLPEEIQKMIMKRLPPATQRELGSSCKSMLALYSTVIRTITLHNCIPAHQQIERIRHFYLSSPSTQFHNIKSIDLGALTYIPNSIVNLANKFPNVCKFVASIDTSDDELDLIITRFSHLDTLDLSTCRFITHEGLQILRACKNLKELNLSFVNISDQTLQLLFTDDPLEDKREFRPSLINTLTSLELSWCKRITPSGFQHLRSLTNLTKLNIRNTNVTDATLEHLSTLTKLRNLDLSDCKRITPTGFQRLRSLTNLTELDISENNVIDATLEHLSSLTDLRSLNLFACNSITSAGFEHLRSLTNLTELNVGFTDFSENINVLTSLIHLKTLNLDSSDIEDEDSEVIGSLVQLTDLSLNYTGITDDILRRCVNRLENLQTLSLQGTDVLTSECFQFLGTLPNLTDLDLSHYEWEEEMSEVLNKIDLLTNIKCLKLHNNEKITDADIVKLNSLPNLEFVDLSNCIRLTPEGINHLITSRPSFMAPLRVNCGSE